MWLRILGWCLTALAVATLAGAAFVAGAFAGKKAAAVRATPIEKPAISPARREAARGFLEAALSARFEGRHAEAAEYLQEARRHDPELRGLDYQLALTRFDLRDYDGAETEARRSLAAGDEKSNTHALLAMIALARAEDAGRAATAQEAVLENFKIARETDPLNPAPHYVLAEYYRATGNPVLALESYRKALDRVSKSDSFLVAAVKAGLSGLRLGAPLESTPSQGIAEADGPVPPEQLFFRAADALLKGDQASAAGFLRQARERVPEPVFKALLQDPLFQDYLTPGTL